MTKLLVGTAFGQVLSLPPFAQKQKQKITKYGIMKKQRITSIVTPNFSQQCFFYSSQKNVYEGLYHNQVQTTVFTNKYANSKIIGVVSHKDFIFAGLNNGSLISIQTDQQTGQYNNQQILKAKLQISSDKEYKRIVYDTIDSFAFVGKQVLPFLYDSNKNLITWNGKNVPNDELDLRVPIHDVDAVFYKSNKSLACAHAHNKVRIYDVRSNKQKASADYHLKLDKVYNKTYLTRILVNPHNQNLFYIANDLGAIYQCDIRREMLTVGKFKSINSTVTQIKVLQNQLYVASLDSYVRAFDIQSKQVIQKWYMNKPIYSLTLHGKSVKQIEQYEQQVLSQAQQQVKESKQKKLSKMRKRNKINLSYLKPINWDQVPIKQELLQEAKQQYEQINAKDADNYLQQEEEEKCKVKDEHDSDKDSDLD